ncbi:nuclear transport factor 2 family protein [Hymenobacter sp. BT491]|uniref:nuclear transport factor 2 family protein n=1 Tax=Hymenobacter sp. BT491 TaxID=2766779 RepID=UPI001653C0DC|nr:nuclear transport factor 2 family protein [Hymenobacter sp. BT491]MBC6988875.1 DUF4440 domain-containing protein [Hymenobacter sp. BT491]
MRLFCCAAAVLLASSLSALAQKPVEAIVAAEQKFAKSAAELGTKAAFLGSMADSAVVFPKGKPTLARPYWLATPDRQPTITWGPEFADAASSGDMGYTTGPWYIEAGGKRVAHGHYNTVWVRQLDQQLKFVADIGVQHAAPEPDSIPTTVAYATAPGHASKDQSADIMILERQLTAAIRAKGMAKAYAAVLSSEARLNRPDQFPLTTPQLQRQNLAAQAPLKFQPMRGQVSQAGDLAYTYGTYQADQQATNSGAYLHIWKHETAKHWRLVLEVLNPSAGK